MPAKAERNWCLLKILKNSNRICAREHEIYATEYAFRLQAGFSFMLPGFSVGFSAAFSIGFSMVFLQPFHGADSFFRLFVHAERFCDFLKGLIISEIIQPAAAQIAFRFFGELNIAHGNGPGNRHFYVIALMADTVENGEQPVDIFRRNIVVQEHHYGKAHGELLTG